MTEARVWVYTDEAFLVTARLDDFRGGLQVWKEALYEMFRWNMTYNFAHRIDVREDRETGVYVSLLIRPAYKRNVVETMESLGFNPVVASETIGTIECTELPEDMLVDYIRVDY